VVRLFPEESKPFSAQKATIVFQFDNSDTIRSTERRPAVKFIEDMGAEDPGKRVT
jgi:hypothetical protein